MTVDRTTGEIVEQMTPAEAHEFVRYITVVQDQLPQRVLDAYYRRAWAALGYDSWDAMCAGERLRVHLPRGDERREFVLELSAGNMSTRAIAPVVGVSQQQVVRDLQVTHRVSPAPEVVDAEIVGDQPAPGESDEWRCPKCNGVDSAEHDDPEDCHCGCGPETGCCEQVRAAAPVIGLDGKSYPKPAPNLARRRNPLPDQARTAGWGLRKSVERLERIAADDRFGANREQVASHLRSHLTNAVEVCQDLFDRLN